MKLSFKKEPKETGLRAAASPYPNVIIKGDGKKVGWIAAKNYHQEKYEVWFHTKKEKTESDPCPFENVRLKFRCDTEEEARAFLKEKWPAILKMYQLYQLND